jgi:hypothetical protein
VRITVLPARETWIQKTAGVSVRLETDDVFTGVVIRSREGESIVLTCDHWTDQGGAILVETFRPPAFYRARVLSRDPDCDLCAMSIATDTEIPSIDLRPADRTLTVGTAAVAIGCHLGKSPTGWFTRVKSVDRYLGEPNLEVAGPYEPATSGGGMFSGGQLIGINSRADDKEWRKIGASYRAIRSFLERMDPVPMPLPEDKP